MSEIVDINPVPTKDDSEFVCDMARFAEGLTGADELSIRKKYRLTDAVWTQLGADDELFRAIENEKIRRVRDGSSKRERAQQLVVKAPDVLGGIMLDASANPRHRIDSAKELNSFASNGPGQSAPASDRFIISIVLNSDVLTFNKSIAPDPNDVDPNHIDDNKSRELFPVIVAKKDDDQ